MHRLELPRDLARELKSCPLFAAMDDAQLKEVSGGCSAYSLESGEHLFEQGQKAERFYVVRSGQIKLFRLSPNGNEKVIELVRPGQSFAEAVMFMDIQEFPVSAEALGPSEVVVVSNRVFLNVLRKSVDTCFRVMGDMSVRLRQRINEVEGLTLQNATLRLINYLLYEIPDCCDDSCQIDLPAAKNIIASRLSVKPETLSRILHDLSDAQLISVQGLTIQIHDIEGLRAYVK